MSKNEKILSRMDEKLLHLAPAAFKDEMTSGDVKEVGASEKYQFIPTTVIMTTLAELGWKPVYANQQKKRKRRSNVVADMTKHLVAFEHKVYSHGVPGFRFRLLVTNSHDRSAAFNFHVGVHRDLNGHMLVIHNSFFVSEELEHLRVRHIGYRATYVTYLVEQITKKLPDVVEMVKRFKKTKLTERRQLAFAAKALSIRYPEFVTADGEIKGYDPHQLVASMRPEDKKDDLWTVFNRIRENLFEGNFVQDYGAKQRKAKPLTNIRLQLLINKELWKTASEIK